MLAEHRVIKLTGQSGTVSDKIVETCDAQYQQGFDLVTAFAGQPYSRELGGLGGDISYDAPVTLIFRREAGRTQKLGLLG